MCLSFVLENSRYTVEKVSEKTTGHVTESSKPVIETNCTKIRVTMLQ